MAAEAPPSTFVKVPPNSDFSIHNLPYGAFIRPGADKARLGVAIGEQILDLFAVASRGLFKGPILSADSSCFLETTLNEFMGKGRATWTEARESIKALLKPDSELAKSADLQKEVLVAQKDVRMVLPARIGDYTDFYSSREHATNVGTMFRGAENALKENWLHLPVGYHGRASSVVISGTNLHRPCGQLRPDPEKAPVWGPCRLMDFEMEMAFFVGKANKLGHRIKITEAKDHIFGVVLMNDWSARDVQKWEYIPLGPFNGKNFGTTISPWVVTLDALDPFRIPGPEATKEGDPAILPYLQDKEDSFYDIKLSVELQAEGDKPMTVCKTNLRNMYWSMKQQLVHHSSTGCNMQPGDLLGSGTISGKTPDSFGSMLEISWKGSKPLTLPGGGVRRFLADGDKVTMRGHCEKDGIRVGFGECVGQVLPALD